jgi:ribosome-binding protein aMBF1 (putative translation factor)
MIILQESKIFFSSQNPDFSKMGGIIMKTWDSYKEHVKNIDPENRRNIADIEEQASIISEMIKQRTALGLSQRDLASICGIPQSSVARIESFQTTPNLATLLKLLRPLGLKLTISK